MDWSLLLSALVGGVIGVAGAVAATILTNRNARQVSREDRISSWRKEAYLELMKAVLAVLMPVARYLEEGGSAPIVSADAFVEARGFALFASDEVRKAYKELVAKFTEFVREKGPPIEQRREQFTVVEAAALALENQIGLEMSKAPNIG